MLTVSRSADLFIGKPKNGGDQECKRACFQGSIEPAAYRHAHGVLLRSGKKIIFDLSVSNFTDLSLDSRFVSNPEV
jgi:hypothetical protein